MGKIDFWLLIAALLIDAGVFGIVGIVSVDSIMFDIARYLAILGFIFGGISLIYEIIHWMWNKKETKKRIVKKIIYGK
jgi:hypothetical protein